MIVPFTRPRSRLLSKNEMAALRREPVAQAMPTVGRLVDDGLLASDGKTIRLTVQGRLLSNDVFQQFLGLD